MAQQLRAMTALPADLGSIPSTHGGSQPSVTVTPALEDPMSSLDLLRQQVGKENLSAGRHSKGPQL